MNKKSKFTQMMLGISTVALSFGSIQTQVSAEENTPYNVLQKKPIGIETSTDELAHSTKADETLSYEERLKVNDFSQRPAPVVKRAAAKQFQQKYSVAELNRMSNDELIDTLGNVSWNQITDLSQFNQETKAFYQNKERIQVIIDELGRRGSTFTKDDTKGIETFVEVLYCGFYLGFNNKELNYLTERSFRDKCLPALKEIAKNPNFKLGTNKQDTVVSAYGKLIRIASCDAETVQYAGNILKQYNDNISTYVSDRNKGDALYNLIQGIDNDIQSYLQGTGKKADETIWYGKIDSFINEISRLALLNDVTTENKWLINNGIYYTGRLGKFHSNSNKPLEVLTQAMHMYPRLSEAYFNAVEQISTNYGGKDYSGNTVDLKKIREEGQQQYLPKTYTFDDGAIVFKTGDKVTEEKVKRLYWAAKEVKAQYHRVIGNDAALEAGKADDVLTIVIYNSPDEYKRNSQLYGYDTNNGGIYIEGVGTFFTYERTPQQSRYSLEELFRHEFTHYLQGRYEVPGSWGQGEMYQDQRLTWFEEGNAEFFAGSTRTNNVVPRKSIISGLSSDPAKRYTAERTLFSKYGEGEGDEKWDFYNYSFALQSYLYTHQFETFDKIQDFIRANDVKNYDAYREALSKDPNLNKGYQDYMKQLIDNQGTYNTPQVSDDYLAAHSPKPLADVKKDITDVAKIKDATITKHKSQFFDTFTLEGTYTGGVTKGESEDWKTMSKQINQSLEQLSQKEWSGYKTVTAHFVNHRVNAKNQFEYDVVFHGVATGEEEKQTVKVNMNGPYNEILNEKVEFHSDGTESTGGKIVSYLWDFGDGTTSTEANPTHVYGKEGAYTAKLTVKDDKGKVGRGQTTVTVKQDEPAGHNYQNAKVIRFNKLYKGNMDKPNMMYAYTFNVTSPKEVDTSFIDEQGIGIQWDIYHESDLENPIITGQADGNNIKGKFEAKPGKYYLVAFFDGENKKGTYSLSVK
ncbi:MULTISPECIES: collagenase ColA [Bacillus cereus group]|uniref:microbial collagenase n=2 Tax=Bacillus cereus group TaxID=86661 RepID=A0A2C1D3E2_BACCE|nr:MULTISPECIES: collagenase ColA [Bacillus cereus group]OFD77159.1 collagenase [Bacillus mycoides]OFD77417.1 collagenase [Bacillus mycoides]OFD78126.1 collagenase [Bacillus mycoides]PGS94931.1 collagenase [Bacillus cereus]